MTELDTAHAAMEAAPDDDIVRLRFFERLADGEMFLLLAREAEEDDITPETFEIEDQTFVLVFDRAERLAQFAGRIVPYAGLSGRALVAMLAGQGIGVALNPDVAPSAMLIAAEAVDWLAATLAQGPEAGSARPREIAAPGDLPEALIAGLDRKLASAGGMAQAAWLTAVTWDDDTRGHMLAFVGAVPAAERALAAAVAEALTFSGIAAGRLDVTFLDANDPIIDRLARVGLRFDLPALVVPEAPRAPGMDPDKPPKLR